MSVSDIVRERIRLRAGDRCGYCLASQDLVFGWLEIEHVVPTSLGGTDDESNLWLACRFCNTFKTDTLQALDPLSGERVALFDPRQDAWNTHFRWSEDGGLIIGRTPTGRATVAQMRLNYHLAVAVRRNWVAVGWHPPEDAIS